jgi:hypothetical protein
MPAELGQAGGQFCQAWAEIGKNNTTYLKLKYSLACLMRCTVQTAVVLTIWAAFDIFEDSLYCTLGTAVHAGITALPFARQ